MYYPAGIGLVDSQIDVQIEVHFFRCLKAMRVIGYTRVSSNSPEQLHALEQHKARLTAVGCTEIYWDIASRSRANREGLNRTLEAIERKECDKAIFIRVDRMTDSPTVLERAINICLQSGIPIVGLDDNIDFETVGGRLHARILCNLARAEVERLAERIKRGHEHHRDQNAAYFAPFGYKKVGDSLELNLDPFLCLLETRTELTPAEIGRDLVETYLEQRSIRGTVRYLHEKYGVQQFSNGKGSRKSPGSLGFSLSGFTAWINTPILRGHTAYGRTARQRNRHKHLWDIRYDTHSDHRLMSDEEFQTIDSTLDWNSKHKNWDSPKSLRIHSLSGLVYCSVCGGSCRVTSFRLRTDRTKKKFSFQCKQYQLKACNHKTSVRETKIEQVVIEALTKQAETITSIAELPPEHIDPPELQELKAELAFYENAPGTRAAGIVADLKQQIADFYSNRQVNEQQQQAQYELLQQVFYDLNYWKTLLPEEKRNIYRALVDKVYIQDGSVQSVELKV